MKKIAISVGDINGIGPELLLRTHEELSRLCEPIYCIDFKLLNDIAQTLKLSLPKNIKCMPIHTKARIHAGSIKKDSGLLSFNSFKKAIELTQKGEADAMCTLPIHKKAWELAGIDYKGHTDYLRTHFKKDAIMMLGCDELFVALYSEHIPLKEVAGRLNFNDFYTFLIDLYQSSRFESIGVLGLNPHAGDDGVLGDEEQIISKAIEEANKTLKKECFHGPLVPDVAFTPQSLKRFNRLVALYHDQGLAPLKALYFEKSINISLNLPIIRTSVDHGTAFDIAYKNQTLNNKSYIEAIKVALSGQFRDNV